MKNTDTPFSLAPELQRDCIELADWPLCKVLLMNDSQYPWFILVPRVAGVKEIIDLSEELQITLLQESGKLSKLLQQVFNPDKLNVAALGNLVEQLHIHVIARFIEDPAWPAPVWGHSEPVAYRPEALDAFVARLRSLLDR